MWHGYNVSSRKWRIDTKFGNHAELEPQIFGRLHGLRIPPSKKFQLLSSIGKGGFDSGKIFRGRGYEVLWRPPKIWGPIPHVTRNSFYDSEG